MKKLLNFFIILQFAFISYNQFGFDAIDFFPQEKEVREQESSRYQVWQEPNKNKPVLKEVENFLENPNDLNGKEYLDWVTQRLTKIFQAQKVLAKFNQRAFLSSHKLKIAPKFIHDKTFAVFLKSGCVPCQQQAQVISDMLDKFLENGWRIKIFFHSKKIRLKNKAIVLDVGQSKYLGIDTWPSLVVVTDKRQSYLFKGLMSQEEIIKILNALD